MKRFTSSEPLLNSPESPDFHLTVQQFVTKKGTSYQKKAKGEMLMVQISEAAEKVLNEYFKDKEVSPIRIFLHSGG